MHLVLKSLVSTAGAALVDSIRLRTVDPSSPKVRHGDGGQSSHGSSVRQQMVCCYSYTVYTGYTLMYTCCVLYQFITLLFQLGRAPIPVTL